MDNWPVCTEWPEDVWNTSSWYAPQIVTAKLNSMAKEGKKLPGVDVVTEIETVVTGTCYALSDGSEGIDFCKYQAPNQLKAHEAYVDILSGDPDHLTFVFEGENIATDIDNVNTEVKSVKIMENGILYIIRDGVRYNVQGQIVK